MSDSAALERRYRRLLACYPRSFRDEHEDEIVAVLMAGADEGRQRPGLAEAVDLIKSAVWMRLGPGSRPAVSRHNWARVLLAAWVAVQTLALLDDVAHFSALSSHVGAPFASAAFWLIELSALALILSQQSRPYDGQPGRT